MSLGRGMGCDGRHQSHTYNLRDSPYTAILVYRKGVHGCSSDILEFVTWLINITQKSLCIRIRESMLFL
jgi:hypothetical protein